MSGVVPAHQNVLPDRSFPTQLREARKEKGLSPQALAEQAHVPPERIEALEGGAPIAPEDLRAICESLALAVPNVLQSPLIEFSALLRDRRGAAGLSRGELGRKAGLSAETIKFFETAKHNPSRRTCLALFNVPELKLNWSDLSDLAGPAPLLPGDPLESAGRAVQQEPGPDQPAASQPAPAASDPVQRPPRQTPDADRNAPLFQIRIEIFPEGRIQVALSPGATRIST